MTERLELTNIEVVFTKTLVNKYNFDYGHQDIVDSEHLTSVTF